MKKARLFPYLSSRKDGAHAPSRWYVGLQNRPIKTACKGLRRWVPSLLRTYISYLVFHGIQRLASQVASQEPQPNPSYKAQHHLAAMLGEYPLAGEGGWQQGKKTKRAAAERYSASPRVVRAVGGTLCVHYTILFTSTAVTTFHYGTLLCALLVPFSLHIVGVFWCAAWYLTYGNSHKLGGNTILETATKTRLSLG